MNTRYFACALGIALALVLGTSATTLAATKTVTTKVEGMTCARCATTIEQALRATDGVVDARVSFKKSVVWVSYDDAKVSEAKLREVINGTGFKAVGTRNTLERIRAVQPCADTHAIAEPAPSYFSASSAARISSIDGRFRKSASTTAHEIRPLRSTT